MANQSSNKWIDIMEKRKDTSTIGPITSTASEISLRFDRQSERTRSNSDSTDNEEIVPITSSPPVDDGSNGDKVSLKEGGGEEQTEEISDKEESTEERRNEKKRLNRNEDGLQEREEKSPKKLKTEKVREKEEAGEVQNETNYYDSDSDSDATDIALTVMDYTDDFYKEKDNTSNKANSMWCSPEVVPPPAGNEIRESGSEVNDDGSSDPSNEEMSQPVANSTNNIADRTNYIDDNSYPEGPRGPSIMINIGLEYCVLNREASHFDDVCAHVVPFGDSSLPVSTDVSSEDGEVGGIPFSGLTNAIELPVSDVSIDPGRSHYVC